MAGRRVENQRRQKYGTSSYVSGNTARKLAAAPQRLSLIHISEPTRRS